MLIVEDSHTVRYEVRMILEKIGILLVEAANEIGMLNMVEQYGRTVDLVIMDLTLKHENGLDLIEKLKASERYSDIPVLVLTEHAGKENVLKARELGVAGYLKKTDTQGGACNRIKSILGED